MPITGMHRIRQVTVRLTLRCLSLMLQRLRRRTEAAAIPVTRLLITRQPQGTRLLLTALRKLTTIRRIAIRVHPGIVQAVQPIQIR